VLVETLIDYAKGATEEMWAFAANKIYNVTTTGAVGAAAVSGLTNNRWQYTIFTTSGDTRIVTVNGADDMRQYNGAVWAAINAGICSHLHHRCSSLQPSSTCGNINVVCSSCRRIR
jgi:hypothetical protein